ncbi:MAG: MBL fold metallo-hydrolase [Deinococcales bacterium]
MKITLLGTGAPIHTVRNTLGILVEATGLKPLLIDTCGGFELSRALAKLGYQNERLQELGEVIVTHQHGDHIGGVMALFIAVKKLDFYANQATLKAIDGLIAAAYPEYGQVRGHVVNHHEVKAGQSYEIAGFKVSFFEMIHRVPTLAVRLERQNKILAFSADGLPCEAMIACAKDADLFICDAMCAAGDSYAQNSGLLMHPTAKEAAEMAKKAGAKALVLTHLVRHSNAQLMLDEARAIFEGPVYLPDDGTTLNLY